MVRYSDEVRLKVVLDVLKNGLSENEAARKYGMNHVTVNQWVAAYLKDGVDGVSTKSNKRTFSGETKQRILEDMLDNSLSYKGAAKKHGVPDSSIRRWMRDYQEKGIVALYSDNRGKKNVGDKCEDVEVEADTLVDLKKENQRLRMEIDYLKKLNALAREKEQSLMTTKLM